MNPHKLQAAVFVATVGVLAAIWAATGFKDTWLYVCLIPVTIPNPWWVALINKIAKKKDGPEA